MASRTRVGGLLFGVAVASLAAAGPAHAQRSINCASQNNRYQYCRADTRGNVRLDKKFSDAPCVYGKSWGYDAHGVWVNYGCRALFVLGQGSGGGGGRPPVGGGIQRITCASNHGHHQYCRARTYGQARLMRQLSKSPCIRGRTWGSDDRGVWVDDGCRGEFEVGRSSGGHHGGHPPGWHY